MWRLYFKKIKCPSLDLRKYYTKNCIENQKNVWDISGQWIFVDLLLELFTFTVTCCVKKLLIFTLINNFIKIINKKVAVSFYILTYKIVAQESLKETITFIFIHNLLIKHVLSTDKQNLGLKCNQKTYFQH